MNLEPIYDEQIAPLMAEIIRIAKEHNMPFVCAFQLTDEEGPLMCTSCLLPDGCSEKLVQAADIIYAPPTASTLTITTRNADGMIERIERIIAP